MTERQMPEIRGHFIMIKGSFYQEDMPVINVYTANNSFKVGRIEELQELRNT